MSLLPSHLFISLRYPVQDTTAASIFSKRRVRRFILPTESFNHELLIVQCHPAIWRFTIYWTLLILCVIFLLCSLLAALNILLSITHRKPTATSSNTSSHPVPTPHPNRPPSPNVNTEAPKRVRAKRKRPPIWPVLLIPVVVTVVAAIIALITGTVVGFALAAVYSAGQFSVST